MPLNKDDKDWIHGQFEGNMRATASAIEETFDQKWNENAPKLRDEITSTILDRIDRLENTYSLEKRVSVIEKKLGIPQES